MTDADMQKSSRPVFSDTPDVSLSAALEHALYRQPDDIGPVDERAFCRALNAAARRGDVTFWGHKQNLAFELAFGPINAVVDRIDPTYFAADEDAAQRGFDAEYNRINAFCFSDDPEIIQGVIDSDQSEYISYSNVRVERDGFFRFLVDFHKSDCSGSDSSKSTRGPIKKYKLDELISFLKENPETTKEKAANHIDLKQKSRTFERLLVTAYAAPDVPRLKVGRRRGSKTKSPHENRRNK
ncbi:hypothetical protein FHS55_003140 [Angulomicrobium tetraedrale]|uniref:Uncharacterized protein n=1 Tax=Ancylobacter tetraedralis TaxID=217068 RepID=A0A839ZCR1_9HYPH|nr:hypothetical protein [Ancylobacter tetraedralis]MBB3772519.1 hypothetical protein [Ancylobacter tetraedralis]